MFHQVAAVFTIGGAATASVLYGILVGAIKTGLKPFDIKADVGTRMLAIYWLGGLFTLAGGFFWLLSVCCCSGRSPYGHRDDRRGITAEKAPYTYERVASPYGVHPGSAVPMHNMPPPTIPKTLPTNPSDMTTAYKSFSCFHIPKFSFSFP